MIVLILMASWWNYWLMTNRLCHVFCTLANSPASGISLPRVALADWLCSCLTRDHGVKDHSEHEWHFAEGFSRSYRLLAATSKGPTHSKLAGVQLWDWTLCSAWLDQGWEDHALVTTGGVKLTRATFCSLPFSTLGVLAPVQICVRKLVWRY